MIIFNAKDFNNREELESEVRKQFDLTPDSKLAQIIGTKKELNKLQLSESTLFWGIKCVETDKESKPKQIFEKINRGKKHESKIQ